MRILVTGASGSGTSTLGRAVAAAFQAAFVDADDLFWLPTDPPFKEKRDSVERAALLRQRLSGAGPVVVSGSIIAWDRELEDAFDLIVFLRAPAELRVERLRAREAITCNLRPGAYDDFESHRAGSTAEGLTCAI